MKKTSWFLFLVLFAFSCLDEPECYLLNNNVAGIYFRVMGSGKLDSLALRRVLINGNVLQTQQRGLIDRFDKDHDTLVSYVQVPLDFFNNSTNLEFSDANSAKPLVLGYRVQVQYVSEECGPRYILSNLDHSESGFDSVRFVDRTPSRDGTGRNIEIFRCPTTDTLTLTLNQLTFTAPTETTVSRLGTRATGADLSNIVVNDTDVIFSSTRKTTIHLPVNLAATTSTYDFNFANDFGYDAPNRELKVGYETTTVERYRHCGSQIFVTDLSIESHTFDSVSIAKDANGFPKSTLTDPFDNNINIYRCPPTNIIQVIFRKLVAGTPQTTSLNLKNITTNYTASEFYKDVTTSTVQLPLDPGASTTTFTVNHGELTETFTLTYNRVAPPSTLFRPGDACSDRNIITGLAVSNNANVTVENSFVAYPPVTNVYVQVPE